MKANKPRSTVETVPDRIENAAPDQCTLHHSGAPRQDFGCEWQRGGLGPTPPWPAWIAARHRGRLLDELEDVDAESIG